VDYQRLLGTLDAIIAGIGTPSDATKSTILGGLNLLQYGIQSPLGTANCDQDPTDDANRADDCGAADAASIISTKLSGGVDTINAVLLPSALGAYDALVALAGCPTRAGSDLGNLPPSSVLALADSNPCKAAAVSAYGYGLPANALPPQSGFGDGGLKAQATLASQKLALVAAGLNGEAVPGIKDLKKALYNAPCDPSETDKTAASFCGISQALGLIRAGVPQLVSELATTISDELLLGIGQPTAGCDPTATLRCAAAALAAGGGDLGAGVEKLVAGVAKLNAGGSQLATGAGDLSAGLGQLDDGAGELAAGTGDALDGSGQIADGAGELAQGLGDAANGSGQIADGLGEAADGAPKLVDGAQRLSDEGTKKLIEAGDGTAQNYGELYATIEAGAERADAENMAYGAPEGAVGLTAYSYVIQGDNGESGRNWTRGLAGLALLGAGAGAFAIRRRVA
jgi:putative membrane protein